MSYKTTNTIIYTAIPGKPIKKSCSKCVYYDREDKSCSKIRAYIPAIGYDYYKHCKGYTEKKDYQRTNTNYDYPLRKTPIRARKTQKNISNNEFWWDHWDREKGCDKRYSYS